MNVVFGNDARNPEVVLEVALTRPTKPSCMVLDERCSDGSNALMSAFSWEVYSAQVFTEDGRGRHGRRTRKM